MAAFDESVTCGPRYFDALRQYTDGDANLVRVFAAGFVNGQAEKVFLGACRGAMFRPSDEYWQMVLDLALDACGRYDLDLASTLIRGEIWILRRGSPINVLRSIADMAPNSHEWHVVRGHLCGVPMDEIDGKFHERKGAGQPCDVFT